MKRAILCAAALWLLGACGNPAGPEYSHNDLQLITAYTAKNACSCLFVMEMDEAYCRAWAKQAPTVYTLTIDKENKTVHSSALLLWGATARFVDGTVGCQFEE